MINKARNEHSEIRKLLGDHSEIRKLLGDYSKNLKDVGAIENYIVELVKDPGEALKLWWPEFTDYEVGRKIIALTGESILNFIAYGIPSVIEARKKFKERTSNEQFKERN